MLMAPAEGLGCGSDGVIVKDVRRHKEGACSSGGKKDDVDAAKASVAPPWQNVPNSEHCAKVSQPSSLHSSGASKDHGFQSTYSYPSTGTPDSKLILPKSSKTIRCNNGSIKRSGMLRMEIYKSKPELHDANGNSAELASSPNIPEKNQLVKQKSSTSRRGDKRDSKVKHKYRCDAFSLKNGFVAINSAAGGSNFFGIYGLKPEIFDITKYVGDQSLEELLCGSYCRPSISKEKGKKATSSSNSLLQSVRKACSILQAPKVLQPENCAETESNCSGKCSTGMVIVGSEECTAEGSNIDNLDADLPVADKVQESDHENKKFDIAESLLFQPKDIFERLALPPPKDLDLLLLDASKASTLKSGADPSLVKPVSQRTGLPPFPWSHSFSGHNKLGSDAVKLSTSRTICQGRWVKVDNPTALQKGSSDLLANFESLCFDQSLVPFINRSPEDPPSDQVSPTSGPCSTSIVSADEYSQTFSAAQTLLNMAAHSKGKPSVTTKVLKKPSPKTMRASKFKGIERFDELSDPPKSTIGGPTHTFNLDHDGFPSKKIRLSSDLKITYIGHTEPAKKGALQCPAPLQAKSPPRKLFRDSNAGPESYAVNLVKKSIMMKPTRGADRPGSSQQLKYRKSSQ